jgi:hypothetical protein
MLVETVGVEVYTPGRGNFEAAKPGEQALHRWQRKADTLRNRLWKGDARIRKVSGRAIRKVLISLRMQSILDAWLLCRRR